jgi:hypothetical protein
MYALVLEQWSCSQLHLELTNSELRQAPFIRWPILASQVDQKLLPLRQNSHEPSPCGIVLLMYFQMSCQLLHTSRETSDLSLWRASVRLVACEPRHFAQVSPLSTVPGTARNPLQSVINLNFLFKMS